MIEQRVASLERQLDAQRSSSSSSTAPSGTGTAGGGRGQLVVQFFEKRRRKATWLSRGDEEVCWECWTVKVTVAEPRTESGTFFPLHVSSIFRAFNYSGRQTPCSDDNLTAYPTVLRRCNATNLTL
jgi:hypothetical protein